MFLTNLPWLGKAFLLTTTIAMVESQSRLEECCTEKMVGSVSYTLLDAAFHGELPHQCLNDCVYTVSGTSSPKFCFQRGDLPTECLSDVPEIELVGGSGPHEGNLMIHGQPICDDGWGHNEAMVVCRQLGYLYGSPTDQSFFGDVSDNFAMDDVQCSGDEEYIWGCFHVTEHNCENSEGAGVICSNEPPIMTTGDQGPGSPVIDYSVVELVGGSGPHEGNVIINGQPVCDDGSFEYGTQNAQVVCRMLGYTGGDYTVESHFGQVSDVFGMDEVQCTGDEDYIWRCPHESTDDCSGGEGFGVICYNGELTTADPGSSSVSGAGSVDRWVHVADASSNVGVADASVELTLGELDLVLTSTTDDQGWAVFTLSYSATGVATIVVSREGYVTATTERLIDSETEVISVFSSQELAEGEHRLVLSWETSTDLDVYALQRNKTTGEIVCKTWYNNPGGCAGVNLDIDVYGYGPETITWTDADNDAYIYELYVHDYDQGGVAGTGASITLYGETTVEMTVADGDSGDLWWMLGTFEPSVGTSSFLIMDTLQSFDPDTSFDGRSMLEEKKKTKDH
jgi:deleted-in-malignant-brain-tumors protein 1